jgi:LPS-assembly protein
MVEGQQLVYPQRIEQLDLSLVAPLFGNTRWVARWNRDLTNGRDIEVFAGLEYDSCCWRASLVARRHLERNDLLVQPQDGLEASNGILFQIQFKGLAGSSNRVDSTLSNGIYGYEKREEF